MNNQFKRLTRKSIAYSQNFLKSKNLVANLLDKSSINKNDILYEIGPGEGIITEELVKHCQKVIAIEIDVSLSKKLLSKFAENPSVEIYLGDFLSYTLPKSDYKIFSNIPFNITADVIRKITETEVPPIDSYLIIQKEAALKYTGKPLGKETQFSILLEPWFELSIIHRFKKIDFYPVPQVDIVLLRIRKRDKPLIDPNNKSLYNDFIVYSFGQWKPSLKEGLKDIFTKTQFLRLAKDLSFVMDVTPTQLEFNQWLGLFRYFLTGVEDRKKQRIRGAAERLSAMQGRLQKIHRTRTAKNWRKHI